MFDVKPSLSHVREVHVTVFRLLTSTKLALPIAICAIGETVCYLAKMNKNYSPNW